MLILLIADIHGNFPALTAVGEHAAQQCAGLAIDKIDAIVNGGDSIVYAPFANETMDWLRRHQAVSILGNTDRGVIKLLSGESLRKPRDPDKRMMYEHAAASLNAAMLQSLAASATLPLPANSFSTIRPSGRQAAMGIFHGSPDHQDEFLFADTPDSRFEELAQNHPQAIIVCGHSHTPFWKFIGGCHFINPGSVGRMFDGNPQASYALLRLQKNMISVDFFRVDYDLPWLIDTIRAHKLPEIYVGMYKSGRKLN